MKLAVFSDIHGNIDALKSIIDDINKSSYDEVICLGDLIGLGPSSLECLRLVEKSNITLILGNHELYSVRGCDINNTMSDKERSHHLWIDSLFDNSDFEYLKGCKLSLEKNYNGKKLLFEHFLLNDKVYPFVSLNAVRDGSIGNCFNDLDYDYIFIGHEHNAFEIKNSKGTKLVCVGSSGCVKDDNTFYTVIDIDDKINVYKKYLKYDRICFEKRVLSNDYPDRDNVMYPFFGIKR